MSLFLPSAGLGRNQGFRTALGLSTLTGQPVRLAGLMGDQPRPKPGLGPGGKTQVAAAARVCNGNFDLSADTREVLFTPGTPRSGDLAFDVAWERSSSAPLSLVAEAVLLPLSAAQGESQVVLGGGTHVISGPTSDELSHVLAPMWASLGLRVRVSEITPGFFPAGGGEVELKTAPAGPLRPINAEQPFRLEKVRVEIIISGLPLHLAEQAETGALGRLELHGLPAEASIRRARAAKGLAVLIWAQSGGLRVGYSAIGSARSRPEALAIDAAEKLEHFLDRGVGLPADQAAMLLAPLACARGASRFTVDSLSPALRGAAEAVNLFWPETVRIDHGGRDSLTRVRVLGRDWGKLDPTAA
jgi:RNA 3'-terminal phosphate cyclase (ATP)